MRCARVLAVGVTGLALSSCAYQVDTPIAPAYDLVSGFAEPIPGRFTILIEPDGLSKTVKVDGYACSAHTYPIDASSSFEESVYRTVGQVVPNLEKVSTPIDRVGMVRRGDTGFIHIRAQNMDVDLELDEGFWTADFEAEMDISASVSIDGFDGRLLGTTVSGSGKGRADAGNACAGGAKAIGEAAKNAMRDLTREIGEKVSNAERLRATAAVAALSPPHVVDAPLTTAVAQLKGSAGPTATAVPMRCEPFLGNNQALMACLAGAGIPAGVKPALDTGYPDASGRQPPSVAPPAASVPTTPVEAPARVQPAVVTSGPREPVQVPAQVQPAAVVAVDEAASCEVLRGRNPSLWALCRSVAGQDRARIVPAAGLDAPLGARLACQAYAAQQELYGPCLARNATRTLDSFP